MFKKIAERMRPSNPRHVKKIKIEFGEMLKQADCDSLLFFMQPNLSWEGSLNKAVLKAAGPALDEYILETVTSPKSGEVFPLPGFQSPFKALFMAVLPDWDGGNGFEERDLLNCYRCAVSEAQAGGLKNLAIPALGRDKRDFPHIRFARLSLKGILETFDGRLDSVKIVCIDRTMMATYQAQLQKLQTRAS